MRYADKRSPQRRLRDVPPDECEGIELFLGNMTNAIQDTLNLKPIVHFTILAETNRDPCVIFFTQTSRDNAIVILEEILDRLKSHPDLDTHDLYEEPPEGGT